MTFSLKIILQKIKKALKNFFFVKMQKLQKKERISFVTD